ncbi:hypothetical protein SLH46_02855 [Draconibacterium sp. IB214405]|uniref:hypothetical protein n=1 Tax=Draconibacterium sp. IB214405 TaxID=3097352 RepID=UPI002A150157|nr:hypothetical protein [Draconibacterium sp. IB214405]MDX8338106.1 hypothetical protein [Draconibacterium sp. IB214405]
MKKAENKQKITFPKISAILLILVATIFASCEGPMGPPGEDGFSYAGSIYEVEVDFTPGNDYSVVVNHPSSIEVLPEDVVLVYILWGEYDGTDIWRLCPQTVVLPEGVIQYNFDYTQYDTQLFLEYTVDELLPAETDNQIFRIAILPIDFVAQKSVDVNDFNSLLQTPELQLNILDKVDLNTIEEIK